MQRNKTASKILQAATKALIKGQGSIEMSDVAKGAKVSVGLAYHYFGSKAGLLSAIINDFYDRYMEVANKRYDGEIPWHTREKKRLSACINFLYHDPLSPIILGKMAQSSEVAHVESEGQKTLITLSAKNILDGQKRGQINKQINPAIAGAAIIGAMRQTLAYVMALETRPEPEELTEQLWLFISGAVGLSE